MKYSIALTLVKGLSPKILNQLYALDQSEKELFEKIAQYYSCNVNKTLDRASQIIEDCLKNNIQIINQKDKYYPKLLLNCVDRPHVIYQKGKKHINHIPCISIVGTRDNTKYGLDITNQIVATLNGFKVAIVSGLAYGIDIIAHRKAIDLNISNFAVLGSGHFHVYPKNHQKEIEKILEIGAVISELPPRSKPTKYNFPKRNRIIAGISQSTVVVESKKKGGSLITAQIAGSYNREVYAVPGNINSLSSEGCNQLVKSNLAILLQDFEQITEELKPKAFYVEKIIKKKLSNEEERVLSFVLENQPVHADKIASFLKYNPSKLYAFLTQMELDLLITKKPGNYYVTTQ